MEQSHASPEFRLHFLDYWHVIKSRWMLVLVVLLVVAGTATIVSYSRPKEYAAAARIKVEPERLAVPAFETQNYPTYDPYFLQTQYEIIQSKKILYPVIEQLGLQKKYSSEGSGLWTTELAFNRLKAGLGVRRFRDTSLIEISVTDQDPARASAVANKVAEVFEQDRLEVKRENTLKGINKLRDDLAAQLERVHQAQTEVERLRKALNVPLIGGVKLSDQTLQQLEQRLTEARVEAVGRAARLQQLKRLSPAQLRNTIATIITDPNVQTLLQSLTDAELRMEVLKQDYGPDHPTVRTEQASLEKLRDQLAARLEGVMAGFEVEYKVAQSKTDDLQQQLDAAKNISVALEGEKYLPFRNAQREEESETKLYETLKQRLQQESIELELPRSPVEMIDRAEPPVVPVRPRVLLTGVLGTMAGLVLGVVLAFLIEYLDTSVKRIEDVEHYLEMLVLGVVPAGAAPFSQDAGSAAHIEAYRALRTSIDFARGQNPINSLCVLSAAPGEGKSLTAANLAWVSAQHGDRVLLVDCDLRRPRVHDLFQVPNQSGLADYLTGARRLDEVITPTKVPRLAVISSGSREHTAAALLLLTSPRMRELIQEASRQFDLILYDTPPVLAISDAGVLARLVGASFLVIQHRRYPRHMSRRARQIIEQSGSKLLGVLINNVQINQTETYFYYHQQYADYLRVSPPAPAAAGPAKPERDKIALEEKY